MSETKSVRITNQPSTFAGMFILLCVICWIASISGCSICSGTSGTDQCVGKALGSVYKDVKIGFEVGAK